MLKRSFQTFIPQTPESKGKEVVYDPFFIPPDEQENIKPPPEIPEWRKRDLARVLAREAAHRRRLGPPVPTAPPGISGLPPLPTGHYRRRDGSIRVRGAPRRSTKSRSTDATR